MVCILFCFTLHRYAHYIIYLLGSSQFELPLWDVGASPDLRPLWGQYYGQCHTVLFCVDSTKLDQVDAPLIQKTLSDVTSSSLCQTVKKFGILCTKCDLPGAASVAAIQKEIFTKADGIKTICTTKNIDLRIFAVSSTDNYPQKRVDEIIGEFDVKIQECKAAKDTEAANKLKNEKALLSSYKDVTTCVTWGTGQLDVINWTRTGVAPAGSSFLNDFNQSNPLVQ